MYSPLFYLRIIFFFHFMDFLLCYDVTNLFSIFSHWPISDSNLSFLEPKLFGLEILLNLKNSMDCNVFLGLIFVQLDLKGLH